MRSRLALLIFCLSSSAIVFAQDTLPKFSAALKNNGKVLISWRNNFQSVSQISIQRSSDSLKNFTTFLTVPDPSVPQNGFVDPKADGRMYYRLFIVLGNGSYLFSKSKHPSSGVTAVVNENENPENKEIKFRNEDQRVVYQKNNKNEEFLSPAKINPATGIEIETTIFIKRNDSLIGQFSGKMLNRFRDSVLKKTKDTLAFIGTDTVLIRSFVPKEVYKISNYVFTTKDGNIDISLPDATTKKYSVKFLELDSSPVFDIKEIKDVLLIVDKTNFVHSGWFRFELFEDGKLKEKNRFFIPKDF
ncbi:MAG TPA: hypothetical protein VHZ50_15870 [Puia sp.]|nr:hypothetical protein [Puia sp.]